MATRRNGESSKRTEPSRLTTLLRLLGLDRNPDTPKTGAPQATPVFVPVGQCAAAQPLIVRFPTTHAG